MLRFECEGAPRDLGVDQGRACRALLRKRFGRGAPGPRWRSDARLRHVLRDLRRYFPHQYEQLEGMARAAGLAPARLGAASVATLLEPSQALGARVEGRAILAVAAPPDAVLRRSRPEGRFAASELTRPALTTALLAVNEAGLAVATAGRPTLGRCAAPAALLVRDCAERFEHVAAATEWCLTRPCAPGTTLLLADAAGDLAAIELSGERPERRVRLPVDGLLLPGVRSELAAQPAADLAKALGAPGAAPVGLQAALQGLLGACAWADPARSSLWDGTQRAQASAASQHATASAGSAATTT